MKIIKNVKLGLKPQAPGMPFKGLAGRDGFDLPNHQAVSRSLRFMAKNFTRPIRLGDVVSVSGMSRRGFMKAFGRHVGRTPGSFIRQARIEFAKQLLIEQDLPLKTIAAVTGFRSENTFCVAFHREAGMAPKKFQTSGMAVRLPHLGIPAKYPVTKRLTRRPINLHTRKHTA